MPNVFEVIDPRDRQVICTEECWNDHILRTRPWMAGWEEEVAEAVQHPFMGIFRDVDFEERDIYYGFNTSKKDRYIKVIVEFKGEELGSVITAFPTSSPKKGETLIWPESNH